MIRFSFGGASLSGHGAAPGCLAGTGGGAGVEGRLQGRLRRARHVALGRHGAAGGYGKAYHQAFHDPCKARAAVFDDGKTRVAIVGIDALFIRGQTVKSVRSAIEKKSGIGRESILISASHTHSGGPIGYYLPGEFDDASPLVRSLVHDRRSAPIPSTSRRSRRRSSRRSARPTPSAPRRGAAWASAARTRSRSIAGSG